MVILMAYVGKLRNAGLKLSLYGDLVRVENAQCLTDRLRDLIRDHKPAIVKELKMEARHNIFLA